MMSNHNLEDVLGAVDDKFAARPDAPLVLSRRTLPQLPEQMTCDELLIKRGRHSYTRYAVARRDFLLFEAEKRTYRLLAFALLAKIFHDRPSVARMQLTHPASDIHDIALDYEQDLHGLSLARGYKTLPEEYQYSRSDPAEAYAWDGIPTKALPAFALATQRGDPIQKTDFDELDVLRCAGSDHGHVRLAQILLDFGHPDETCNTITLEGELGNKGVDPYGPEVRFLLPGSFGSSGEL